jgi:oligopeptide/dipeptide ABC transporter ATP-binding protein
MKPPELEVDHLKVTFTVNGTEFRAVNGISYTLGAGETLALVGESGSGKTVSALAILRLVPEPPGKIVGGAIRFRGQDLLTLPPAELRSLRGRRIAMIFQEPMTSLNPVFSIADQIGEPLRRHEGLDKKTARTRAVDLLRRVEIASPERIASSYPHQLSGGMRQRAMIAMAIACNPALLIADEPTTALDVLIQAQILDLLKRIKEETGMSILLITHDLGVVSRIARRVMVMYAGEIVEAGPVSDVLRTPLHPYTRGLVRSLPTRPTANGKRARLFEIVGGVPALDRLPAGCPFHPRCPDAEARCKTEKPQLKEIAPGHSAACWLHA